MTYDERDRGETPDAGTGESGHHPGSGDDIHAPDAAAMEPGDPRESVSDAPMDADETSAWPSTDPGSASADTGAPSTDAPRATWSTEPPAAGESAADAWPTTPPAAGESAADAWPTTPPAAGESAADAWPTSPPEMGGEPILEPEPIVEPDDAASPSGWDAAAAATATTSSEPAPIDDLAVQELEPDEPPMSETPPPSEVEAYPAAAAAGGAAAGTAAGAAGAESAHAVPAAESATGESTQCPRCGTENRPGLAFCRNCGQRLVAAGVAATVERPGTPEGTQACPRCGTHNRAGVAFCQNCGANLRGTAPGYVPPAVAGEAAAAPAVGARGAVLGPVVLLIGLVGLVTAYLLPFAFGTTSLFERAWGADGYGIAFWSGYPEGASLADSAYYGLAAPIPIFGVLLLALAIAGFMRASPGRLQTIGLVIALVWSVALIVLFLVVEVFGNWDGDVVGLLRLLSPGGIILFLTSLIILIGTLTRFARS